MPYGSNRFNILKDKNTEHSANSMYKNFKEACAHTAEKITPAKPKARHRIPWETEEVIQKRTNLKNAVKNKNSNPTRENEYLHRTAQATIKESYEKEQVAFIQTKIDCIASASVNKQAAIAWKTVNEISGRKSCNKAKIKDTDQNERLNMEKAL